MIFHSQARQQDGARCVLLPEVLAARQGVALADANSECLPALADRLFRAASGKAVGLSADGHLDKTIFQVEKPL